MSVSSVNRLSRKEIRLETSKNVNQLLTVLTLSLSLSYVFCCWLLLAPKVHQV